jgi:hypothetical protein
MFFIIAGVVGVFIILCIAMAWRMKNATHYRGPVSDASQTMGKDGHMHHHDHSHDYHHHDHGDHDHHSHHHHHDHRGQDHYSHHHPIQVEPPQHGVHSASPVHNPMPAPENVPPPTHTHH